MNIRDLLRLSSVPRLGPLKIRALLARFDDPAVVLQKSPRELAKTPGIDKKLAAVIAHHDGSRFAESQLHMMNRIGGRFVSLWDPEYPDLLKRIYDPPPLLYVLGAIEPADKVSLGIVGTRKPSPYGRATTEIFASRLVGVGMTIVSGLARGVDTHAHTAALNEGGRTIAVIGSGLDVPYPPENRSLMERITRQGAVLSEFPFGTQPEPSNFPRRNRLISGISLGTVVVESDENGGAMITASTALDQNREVFALPGMISEKRSIGPHRLIQQGRAKLVHSVEDILDELQPLAGIRGSRHKEHPPIPELSLFERRIFDLLPQEPMHIDSITEASELSTSDTLVTLLSLEFKGLVKQMPGKYFQKALTML